MAILISYLTVWLLINLSHAAAHLVVARWFSVSVNRISLGIGPTLWSRQRGQTTFRVALVPIALLVRLRARWKDSEEVHWSASDSRDLRSRSLGVRAIVFSSAPAAVLALALASAFIVTGFEKTERDDRAVVGRVVSGMPAENAGIEPGDFILSVNGERPDGWLDVVVLVSAVGEGTVRLEVRRGLEELSFDIEPARSPIDDRTMVGILPGTITVQSPSYVVRGGIAASMVAAYGNRLVQGFVPALSRPRLRTVSGPIAISSIAADRAGGALTFWTAATYFPLTCLAWCVVFPYLDGRRMLFLFVELLARKPIHPKYEQRFNLVWLVVVVGINVAAMVPEIYYWVH